jgi:hypothetical protein
MSRMAGGNMHKVSHDSGPRHQSETSSPKCAEPGQREIARFHEGAGSHALDSLLGEGKPLDAGVRENMEACFGESFAEVRVYDSEAAHRSAAELDAKAYTVGENIAFSAERYAPHHAEGKRLLAHELAHVVQQRRGGPQPELSSDATHERSAERSANEIANGAAAVSVQGGTGVGVARDEELDDEEERKRELRAQRERDKAADEQRAHERSKAGRSQGAPGSDEAEAEIRKLETHVQSPGGNQRSQRRREKKLKKMERLLPATHGSMLEKNIRKGDFDEAQRTPKGRAAKAQSEYVAGGPKVPGQEFTDKSGRKVASHTRPDYSVYRQLPDGGRERVQVNLKAHQIDRMTPAEAGRAAREILYQAVANKHHLPKGEKLVIDFAHRPSAEVQEAIKHELFRKGSDTPIDEIRFGGSVVHREKDYAPKEGRQPLDVDRKSRRRRLAAEKKAEQRKTSAEKGTAAKAAAAEKKAAGKKIAAEKKAAGKKTSPLPKGIKVDAKPAKAPAKGASTQSASKAPVAAKAIAQPKTKPAVPKAPAKTATASPSKAPVKGAKTRSGPPVPPTPKALAQSQIKSGAPVTSPPKVKATQANVHPAAHTPSPLPPKPSTTSPKLPATPSPHAPAVKPQAPSAPAPHLAIPHSQAPHVMPKGSGRGARLGLGWQQGGMAAGAALFQTFAVPYINQKYLQTPEWRASVAQEASELTNQKLAASSPRIGALLQKQAPRIQAAQAEGREVRVITTVRQGWQDTTDPDTGFSRGDVMTNVDVVDIRLKVEGEPYEEYAPDENWAARAFRSLLGHEFHYPQTEDLLEGTNPEAARQRKSRQAIEASMHSPWGTPMLSFEQVMVQRLEHGGSLDELHQYATYRRELAEKHPSAGPAMNEFVYWSRMQELAGSPREIIAEAKANNIALDTLRRNAVARATEAGMSSDAGAGPAVSAYWTDIVRLIDAK